jgi:HK97 family phage major capsid protein
MLAAIKSAIDGQATAFEEYKKVNDQRIASEKIGNDAKAAEYNAKLARIEADIKKFADMKTEFEVALEAHKERIEEIESKRKLPGVDAADRRQSEYKATFNEWVRQRGNSPGHEQKLHQQMLTMAEHKDVTIGSAAGGGYAVPEEISRQIENLERKLSPVRRLVKVVQTGTSDYKELVNLRGATGGWVGESGSRAATSTPTLREVAPTHGELYAYPQCSEWSLDDIFFNVEQWISEEVALAFALAEGDAVLFGNGSSMPTGMLNTTPTTAADAFPPTRAAAVYQYVQGGGAGSPTELEGDDLIDLVYTLNAQYRAGAAFVFNSNTAAVIRKLKDLNGQYLWQPGLQAGEPASLLGYRMETWEQMHDCGVGSGNFPIAFGNFSRGYVLTDRVGLRITRDNVTNVGFVRFYVRRREGGIVLNNDAIKWLRV